MVDVHQQSDAQEHEPSRFNVLVTEDRPRPEEYWTRQLGRLLEPLGVATHMAESGSEALDLADRLSIHAAVVDMATPMDRDTERQTAPAEPASVWLKQLARHLPNRPIVVIHGRVYSRSRADRSLRDALGFGAFSVLHKPVEVEQLLRVLQRMLDRRYQGGWPENQTDTDMDSRSWQ
jgi:CheY-like chemotaxis protein